MKFNTKLGEIEFDIPEDKKNIVISISGGCDSAFLSWAVLSYLRKNKRFDNNVIFTHCIDLVRDPKSYEYFADPIISLFEKEFSDINIERDVYSFTEQTWNPPKNDPVIEPNPRYGNRLTKGGAQHIRLRQLLSKNKLDAYFLGRTANPPIEVQKELNMKTGGTIGGVPHREIENVKDEELFEVKNFNGHEWIKIRPLIKINKSVIASFYDDISFLKEKIFPLTHSCVGTAEKTDNSTKPCKNCWWCKEKYWAFGQYDGGTLI